MPLADPVAAITRSASPVDGDLLGAAEVDRPAVGACRWRSVRSAPGPRRARGRSSAPARPVPKTVSGSPASACRTNRGMTIPYRPVCRGPTVLKNRDDDRAQAAFPRRRRRPGSRRWPWPRRSSTATSAASRPPGRRPRAARPWCSCRRSRWSMRRAGRAPWRCAASTTFSVPWMLVRRLSSVRSRMTNDPTAAARWKTQSAPDASSSTEAGVEDRAVHQPEPRLGRDRPQVLRTAGAQVIEAGHLVARRRAGPRSGASR